MSRSLSSLDLLALLHLGLSLMGFCYPIIVLLHSAADPCSQSSEDYSNHPVVLMTQKIVPNKP